MSLYFWLIPLHQLAASIAFPVAPWAVPVELLRLALLACGLGGGVWLIGMGLRRA